MVKKKSIHRKRSSKKRVSRKRRSKKRSSKKRVSRKRISKRRIRKKTQKGAAQRSDSAAAPSRITPPPASVLAAKRRLPLALRLFDKIDDEMHPMHTDLFNRHLKLHDKVETIENDHASLRNSVTAAAGRGAERVKKVNKNSADLELLNKHFIERVPPLLAKTVNENSYKLQQNSYKLDQLFNIIPGTPSSRPAPTTTSSQLAPTTPTTA